MCFCDGCLLGDHRCFVLHSRCFGNFLCGSITSFLFFLSGWNIPECWYRGKGLKLLVKCIKKYFESCHDMRLSVVFLKRSLKNKGCAMMKIIIYLFSRYLDICLSVLVLLINFEKFIKKTAATILQLCSQPMIINDFIRGDFSY